MDTAERAIDFARHELADAGNPAWTAVAVHADGSCSMGPLIVAAPEAAAGAASALRRALPGADVLLVGCEHEGDQLRITVMRRPGGERIVQRNEVRELPIGGSTVL